MLSAGGLFMDDEVFFALSALLLAEELAAKRAHLAACTLTDGALAEGAARLACSRCRPPRGAYLSCGGHAVKRGKGMLSARDTLRFLLQGGRGSPCAAISGVLLAAGSRAPPHGTSAALFLRPRRPRRSERAFIPRFPRSREREGRSFSRLQKRRRRSFPP